MQKKRAPTDAPVDGFEPIWHAVPVAQLLRHFELDPQRGLEASAVRRARARHGANALPEAPPKPVWRSFARQFKSPLIYILFVAAVLAVALGPRGDALVILVMDPADGDEMPRGPVARNDRLLGTAMLWRVALMAPVIAGVSFGWFASRLGQGMALETVRTETFTVLAMCQWFNVLSCQSAHATALGPRILRNPWLLGGLTLSVLLQALVLCAPPMNALFHTVPLPLASLLPLLGLASLVLWAEEARKLWARRLWRARP